MNRNKSLAAILGVAAGTVLMAAPAYANKPVIDEPAATGVLVCGGTAVDVVYAMDGEKGREQKDGSLRVTGVFKARFTNPLTGQSIVINGSGPGTLTVQPDGTTVLTYEGRSVGISETFDPGAVYWSAGPGSVNFDTGAIGSMPPLIRNVCDQLTQP